SSPMPTEDTRQNPAGLVPAGFVMCISRSPLKHVQAPGAGDRRDERVGQRDGLRASLLQDQAGEDVDAVVAARAAGEGIVSGQRGAAIGTAEVDGPDITRG